LITANRPAPWLCLQSYCDEMKILRQLVPRGLKLRRRAPAGLVPQAGPGGPED
jgi:hypothetical protein